jgi:GTP-binding protein YchF
MASAKKAEVEKPPLLLGRASNNVSIGIVGMPNVGKSTLFNALSKLNVPAENYPFCTIDPSTAKVPVPDDRFDHLVATYKPKSIVPAVLTITDIAGLVKGAHEGKGLGNAFLSNIGACDAIYHVCRGFKDSEIEHVEGSVDPVRDLDIITNELIQKDLEKVNNRLEHVKKLFERGMDKSKKQDVLTLTAAKELLDAGKDVRFGQWKNDDIDILNEQQFLSAKPVIYLVNIGNDEYALQKNKYLAKINEWVKNRDPYGKIIPFSAQFEAQVCGFGDDEAARKAFLVEKKVKSMMPKIITTGYHALDLIHFFTCGPQEVRAWTVKKGTQAPRAAGVIHSDFEKFFICAETMTYEDFVACGSSESQVKAGGKYKTQGKAYVVQDGDIFLFKHNAGGAGKK